MRYDSFQYSVGRGCGLSGGYFQVMSLMQGELHVVAMCTLVTPRLECAQKALPLILPVHSCVFPFFTHGHVFEIINTLASKVVFLLSPFSSSFIILLLATTSSVPCAEILRLALALLPSLFRPFLYIGLRPFLKSCSP